MRSAMKAVGVLILRELRAIRRELEAYPDEASVWRPVPGMPNSAGTLALHVAGNLQHFFGVLSRDGYTRNREAEFADRDVPRATLVAGLDAAAASVQRALDGLSDAALEGVYPLPIADAPRQTLLWLSHLVAHTAYHLGQIDYHRRAVTGNVAGVDAVSVRELPRSEG